MTAYILTQRCTLLPCTFPKLEDEEIGVQIGGVRTNNLHFSEDTALLAESPNELQAVVNKVVEVSESFGIKVNIEKTDFQHMGRPTRILTL